MTARKLGARVYMAPDGHPQRASLLEAKAKRARDRDVLRAAVLRAVVRCGSAGGGLNEVSASAGLTKAKTEGLLGELVAAGSVSARDVPKTRRGEPATLYAATTREKTCPSY